MSYVTYRLPLLTRNGINNDSLLGSLKCIKEIDSREGSVEICKSKRNGKLYVVKSVKHSSKSTPPNEAEILGSLPKMHVNIVNILAAELTPQGYARMVFEHYSGGDLADDISRYRGNLPAVLGLHAAVSVAEAMAFIHHGLINTSGRRYEKADGHKAVVHSDIKADNVFLRTPGKIPGLPDVVLADFGCAILRGERMRGCCKFYKAPELGGDNCRPTFKSDCYSYGVMIYEMIRGQSREWNTGRDPESINFSSAGRAPSKALLTAVLQADPRNRKDMSADGALGMIATLREARDALLRGERPRRDEGPQRAQSHRDPGRRRAHRYRYDRLAQEANARRRAEEERQHRPRPAYQQRPRRAYRGGFDRLAREAAEQRRAHEQRPRKAHQGGFDRLAREAAERRRAAYQRPRTMYQRVHDRRPGAYVPTFGQRRHFSYGGFQSPMRARTDLFGDSLFGASFW